MPHAHLPGTSIEIVDAPPRRRISHALFDLDGTVSLLRDGWQDSMVPMMVEALEVCPRHESHEELQKVVVDFVDRLTGKQTIYQMIRLAEEVTKRGGAPRDPLEYKKAYIDRLSRSIRDRLDGVRQGHHRPEDYLLPGSREFLAELNRRQITCYLASGTDVEFVNEDVDLLDVAKYFKGGIFGALPNYKEFSKARVIREVIDSAQLARGSLLVVGDGYVEIENARSVGAVAFGIFSREKNRYHMNADKRERLNRAGAHFVAADLREARAVLDYLERS